LSSNLSAASENPVPEKDAGIPLCESLGHPTRAPLADCSWITGGDLEAGCTRFDAHPSSSRLPEQAARAFNRVGRFTARYYKPRMSRYLPYQGSRFLSGSCRMLAVRTLRCESAVAPEQSLPTNGILPFHAGELRFVERPAVLANTKVDKPARLRSAPPPPRTRLLPRLCGHFYLVLRKEVPKIFRPSHTSDKSLQDLQPHPRVHVVAVAGQTEDCF
jgi:hypothetical protein